MAKGKIQKAKQPPKIKGSYISEQRGGCPHLPAFSFLYLTTNKKNNFDYFKDKHEKAFALESMFKRLQEIGQKEHYYWLGLGKDQGGCEKIPYFRLHFSPANVTISQDEMVFIFRFALKRGSNAGRIIAWKKDACPILYIIGFDFNYNAYDH